MSEAKKQSVEIKTGSDIPFEQILELYNSVGWTAYTGEEHARQLQKAIQNSTYVVTSWDGEKLTGLARVLSDDTSIFYLQDILVHPDSQRKGIGRKLLDNCIERFKHVRTKILLTDDEERQRFFYESLGFKNTKDLKKFNLNAFVRMEGAELE